MKIFLSIIGAILGIILLIILGFALTGVNLFSYSFFAPKYAAVQRQVYENTPSYLLGKEQEIAKDRQEYLMGNDDTKAIIKSVLMQSMAGVDRSKLSVESQTFLGSLNI